MTNGFAYDPLDLENRTFRLVRLGKGQTGDPIQCELFHAYVGDREDDMEYEALSYTWGGMDKPCSISMNNQVMCITSNLFQALEHLRNNEEDRVLWIDALCIDQENPKERGHQVRQMASIYERARQVIFWLGAATYQTDRAFSYMREFEKEILKYSCNYWEPSDERWQIIWSTVETQLQKEYSLNKVMQRTDYDALLNRDWFDRIWIIQEVAKARSARVVCGTKSVSTRVFALFPSLIGVQPTPHRQAVLDIMPGPLRKFSWWLWDQDLETLLRKFQGSKATDPRDMVYALLGISTDANNTKALASDYSKSPREVARTTIAFLLGLGNLGISSSCLPPWTLPEFLRKFSDLRALREGVIICAFNEKSDSAFLLSSEIGISRIEYLDQSWKTARMLKEAVHTNFALPEQNGWGLLLDTNRTDIEYLDRLSREGRILTPLSWAAQTGRATVEVLLPSGVADVNLSVVVKLEPRQTLLRRRFYLRDLVGRTPLLLAAFEGHTSTAELILKIGRTDVNARDKQRTTPLAAAAEWGHTSIVDILLKHNQVQVNSQDLYGYTPLARAAANGHTSVVELLLKDEKVDVDLPNQNGATPLGLAARYGRMPIAEMLLRSRKAEVNFKNSRGETPLSLAILRGQKATYELLKSYGAKDDSTYEQWWGFSSRSNGRYYRPPGFGRYGNVGVVPLRSSTNF